MSLKLNCVNSDDEPSPLAYRRLTHSPAIPHCSLRRATPSSKRLMPTREMRLRDPADVPFFSAPLMQHWRPSSTRVELEGSAVHDDGSRMIPGLITHVPQGFCASHKEAPAQTALISNDPVAAAVLTDHKDLWPLTRRRFGFCCIFHLRVPNWVRSVSLGLDRSFSMASRFRW